MDRIKIIIPLLLLFLSVCVSAQTVEKTDTLTAARISTGRKQRNDAATQTGLKRIDASEINRGFALFGAPDVIKTLQNLPGVAVGSELMSGLFVHGGDGSDNLFLLDGVPLGQVTHLVGLFSSFNSDLVESVDFYKSGFPARFGGRASSVVDVRTRPGDFNRFRGSWTLGSADGRLHLEGPLVKGRTSLIFGLRRSWTDIMTTPALAYANYKLRRENGEDEAEQFFAGYHFSDVNLGITHRFSDDNLLSLNIYGGMDKLHMSMDIPDYEEVDGVKHYGHDTIGAGVKWGNFLSSVRWENGVSDELYFNMTGFFSRNYNDISLNVSAWSWEAERDLNHIIRQTTCSRNDVAGLNANAVYKLSHRQDLRFGLNLQYKAYHPYNEYYIKADNPIQPMESSDGTSAFYEAVDGALFAEDEIRIGDMLTVNIGGRLSGFEVKGRTYLRLEPRISFKAQCSANTAVKLSYSEMNQYDHSIATTYIDLPTNTWMPSTAVIKPIFSRQIAGGVYSTVTHDFKLTSEFWYRTLDNLYEYGGTSSLYPPITDWEEQFVRGRGRSWGWENMLEYSGAKLTASIAYTLSWSQRLYDMFYFDWYPDRNDNRHKLDILVNYRFNRRFELYGGWHFHSGNRVTAAVHQLVEDGNTLGFYTIYDRPNNIKLPDYHRLDVGFNWNGKTRRGHDKVLNVSLYNAYCRMNPFFAYIEKDDETGKWHGTAIGLIPIIPSITYSVKF